jgi:hypothetical protein
MSAHEELQRFYWQLQPVFSRVKAIVYDTSVVIVFAKDKGALADIKKQSGLLETLKLQVHMESAARQVSLSGDSIVLYDPDRLLDGGGDGDNDED